MAKKSIVIHSALDDFVRKTWAMLIEQGHDASYSSVLNMMLLAAIMEGLEEEGFSDKTRQALQSFVAGQDSLGQLKVHERLKNLRKFWGIRSR